MADQANDQAAGQQAQPTQLTPSQIANLRDAAERAKALKGSLQNLGDDPRARCKISATTVPDSSPRRTRRGGVGDGGSHRGAAVRSLHNAPRQVLIASSSRFSTCCRSFHSAKV